MKRMRPGVTWYRHRTDEFRYLLRQGFDEKVFNFSVDYKPLMRDSSKHQDRRHGKAVPAIIPTAPSGTNGVTFAPLLQFNPPPQPAPSVSPISPTSDSSDSSTRDVEQAALPVIQASLEPLSGEEQKEDDWIPVSSEHEPHVTHGIVPWQEITAALPMQTPALFPDLAEDPRRFSHVVLVELGPHRNLVFVDEDLSFVEGNFWLESTVIRLFWQQRPDYFKRAVVMRDMMPAQFLRDRNVPTHLGRLYLQYPSVQPDFIAVWGDPACNSEFIYASDDPLLVAVLLKMIA